MKDYYKYIKPYLKYFILAPLCMIVEVYCDVKVPSLAGEILNKGVAQGSTEIIVSLVLQMIGHLILAITGGIGAAYFASRAAVFFSCDLRSDVFKKIQKFSFANIDEFSTGSLITRLTNDITQMQELVVIALRMMLRAPGMLIGSVIMAFTINAQLAMVFVVLIPTLAVISAIIINFSYKKFSFLQVKIDALNATVREALTNVRVVKSFAREEFETEKFSDVNADLKNTGLSAYRLTILQQPVMTLVVNMATIFIVYSAGIGVWAGEMEIGNITSFTTYLMQIAMSVNMLSNIFLQGSRAIASAKRISEVLNTDIDLVDDNAKQSELKVTKGDITFKDVDFKYYKNNKDCVLSKINIDIKAGQMVGVIGSTGCGKSSLVQLIPRLYDADNGEVLVDGVNVKDYSLKNLRDGVAVVLQNNILFSGTIVDNLLWGDNNALDKDLYRVSDWSCSSEFIHNLPDGYSTILGQAGVNLSGGQKQRLCIGRALLKSPKILILDDSTSAVDTRTESEIKGHFFDDLAGVTKIIIAQRISSVVDADMVIVMNDGEVEAVGKHDDLMINCKTYKEIYDSQASKEAVLDDE